MRPILILTSTKELGALELGKLLLAAYCAALGSHIKKTLQHPKTDADERVAFQARMEAYKDEGNQLIYLDESSFAHDMPRTHGYSNRGERCYGTHDWHAKGRTNVIGALLEEGVVGCGHCWR